MRKWNKVKGSNINLGQSLVIQTKKKVTVNEIVKNQSKKQEVKPIVEDASIADVTLDKTSENKEVLTIQPKKERIELKEDYYIVQKRRFYFFNQKKIPQFNGGRFKKKNNLPNNNIQPGMKLKFKDNIKIQFY